MVSSSVPLLYPASVIIPKPIRVKSSSTADAAAMRTDLEPRSSANKSARNKFDLYALQNIQ